MKTLAELLAARVVDDLKALAALLPDAPRAGRKDELIAGILRGLSASHLPAIWAGLDTLQQHAVAQAAHAPDGAFRTESFRAKHGRLPSFAAEPAKHGGRHRAPTPLALLLHEDDGARRVPADLREALRSFVPEPEPVRLLTIETLPETWGEARLTVRLTEPAAMQELPRMLRLAEQGKLQISDASSQPTAATLRLLAEPLAGGDHYADAPPAEHGAQPIGPIKAFAWPMLLQAAKLVQRHGSKLAPSKAGLKAVGAPPAEVLRTIWQAWCGSTLLDEFGRVDAIKGQKGRGRVMTAVAGRRDPICDVLADCPSGEWIAVDELSRFMRATEQTFDLVHDPWRLYIGEARYGSLGYAGSHDWDILQLRYLLCFLFEYVATLGVVDIACVPPADARPDFRRLWGTEDLPFLSRYDGLAYIRVTPLGRYCLGSSAQYLPATARRRIRLSVLPSLRLQVAEGEPSPEEAGMLHAWAVQETPVTWRLDRQQAVLAIERGRDIADLRDFLQARDEQPLPDPVTAFIAACERNGKALKLAGTALLIECVDAQTAERIATDKAGAAVCLRAGERHLAVRLEHETKFRALVRHLGLGLLG